MPFLCKNHRMSATCSYLTNRKLWHTSLWSSNIPPHRLPSVIFPLWFFTTLPILVPTPSISSALVINGQTMPSTNSSLNNFDISKSLNLTGNILSLRRGSVPQGPSLIPTPCKQLAVFTDGERVPAAGDN
nr:hypothetical protein Iba_chr11aCG8070 [Ipomoea batatas]